MSNYAQARKSMVDSQIQTMGVVTDSILNAFRTVPRELFVPDRLRSIAYVDEDLPLGDGRMLMEPALLARMIEAVGISPSDIVLNIGDLTGYSSAILSMLGSTIITVEARNNLLDSVRRVWAECSCANVAVIEGDVTQGCPAHAPYDVVFVNGAVAEVPEHLLNQLSHGGRMVVVLQPAGTKVGMATIIERLGDGKYATRKLFDCTTPYIHGFGPQPDFVF